MSAGNGQSGPAAPPKRNGVAPGRFVECRFRVPGAKPPRTALGMAVVKEVHPDRLVVKVFGGTAQEDPLVEIDRLRGEWRLLYD